MQRATNHLCCPQSWRYPGERCHSAFTQIRAATITSRPRAVVPSDNFFGTPHLEADAAVYGDIVASVVSAVGPSVYKEVLRGLKPDAEVLANINTDFNDLLNKSIPPEQKIQIFSFQEGKGITSIGKLDGKVSLQQSFTQCTQNKELLGCTRLFFFLQQKRH
jgi:hypothetical protein